ncbi:MAG: ATP-binding protein [Patescibacteria group bacterium]
MDGTSFIDTIKERYSGGRDRLFILHGNTGDLFPHRPKDGSEDKIEILTLPDFLYRRFTVASAAKYKIWTHYSLGFGIRWINPEADGLNRFEGVLTAEEKSLLYSQRPLDIMRAVERASTRPDKSMSGARFPLRIILTEGHLVIPNAPVQFMRPEDRELLVLLKRFAAEPAYDPSDTMIILVTDALSGIHRELCEVAVTIEIPRPSETEIGKYLDSATQRHALLPTTVDSKKLVSLAVGLTHRQIEGIAAECKIGGHELGPDLLRLRRKELIRRDFGDFLEIFEPQWTLDDVGGSTEAVTELRKLAQELKDMKRGLPSGIIIVGQNGIGKTFLAKALLGTAGITGASLLPFKDPMLGVTERNWAKIAMALRSSNQIGVIVDEADAQMGQRTGPNVHEVSKAIFASQMELMGDPAYRGRIFWILMTCRPDKLAPDVKRPGRADRVIPLFPIATIEDAMAIIRAQMALLTRKGECAFVPDLDKRLGRLEGADNLLIPFVGKTGAQVEKLFLRAGRLANTIDAVAVKQVLDLEAGFRAEPEAHRLQRLLGISEAIETENTDLIPPMYQKIVIDMGGVSALKSEIEVLRARVDYT